MRYFVDGYIDGPNPSMVGGGFLVCDQANNVLEHQHCDVRQVGGSLHDGTQAILTNNQTELLAILAALLHCGEEDVVMSDSQNAIAWVTKGPKKITDRRMRNCATVSRWARDQLLKSGAGLRWIAREQNLAGVMLEHRRPALCYRWREPD